MDISVVIVSYNVREYIISCIESIYKHTSQKIEFEIIVVDNNSSDQTIESVLKKFSEVNIIENGYNAGFTIAANQGAKNSIGKYLFLNPDTRLDEDSLKKDAKEKLMIYMN